MARFAVSNLHPGSVYIISIYAFNSKGRSDPAVLPAAMLRPAEKQLTAEKGEISNVYFHIVVVLYKKKNMKFFLQKKKHFADTNRHRKKCFQLQVFNYREHLTIYNCSQFSLFLIFHFAIFVHDKMAHFPYTKQ